MRRYGMEPYPKEKFINPLSLEIVKQASEKGIVKSFDG